MPIFKEYEIKKMLNYVQEEQMTFSRMVEILNQTAYKELAHKGNLVTMSDIVKTLECFLIHNEPIKNNMEIKIKEFINYMKNEIAQACLNNLKK